MDLDAPPGALDRAPGAGVLVEGNAVVLEGRVHRRQLLDRAAEAPERGGHLLGADVHRPFFEHRAFGVGGAGGHAELHGAEIFLVGLEHRPGELGRLAHEDQQQAGGQRVQRARVPRLLCTQQLLRLLQRPVGREADRLVEQQRAVDHLRGFSAESIRRDSRSPRSTDSSYSKRSSGVV